MDFLDTLRSLGTRVLGNGSEAPASAPSAATATPLKTGNPLMDMFLSSGMVTPTEVSERTAETKKDRESLFGEVWESILARYFPNISKWLDIASAAGFKQGDEEVVPWQNEFEAVTAFTLFMPDFMLRYVTDPFAESEVFLSLVEKWPGLGKSYTDKIRERNDPDDVINVLRIMHQDLIVGKVTYDKSNEWLKEAFEWVKSKLK